jgi:hypothetical protein
VGDGRRGPPRIGGWGGSDAAVGWPAATREWRSWAGGGAGVPHGRMPVCNGGGGGRKVGHDTVPDGSGLNLLQI